MRNICSHNHLVNDILLLLEKYHTINKLQPIQYTIINGYKGFRNVPKPYPMKNLYIPHTVEKKEKLLKELKNSLINGKFLWVGDEILINFGSNCVSFSDKLNTKHVININSLQQAAFIVYCFILTNICRWEISYKTMDFTHWIQSFTEKQTIVDDNFFLTSLHSLSLKYNLVIF